MTPPDVLERLGASMRRGDAPPLPAGFTYLGQFVNHDLDPPADPGRAAEPRRLDLDSVYGWGPKGLQPARNPDDRSLLALGSTRGDLEVTESFPSDLPRDGTRPDVPDERNDENLILAQLHVAFIHFHNAVAASLATAADPDERFDEARRIVVAHYQWVVRHEYLPAISDPAVLGAVERIAPEKRHFRREHGVPAAFHGAAFRFGHAMVRGRYALNRYQSGLQTPSLGSLFRRTGRGGRVPLASSWIVDWRRFFRVEGSGVEPNESRPIGPTLVEDLYALAAHHRGPNLALLDLEQGEALDLPTGQVLAEALDYDPIRGCPGIGIDPAFAGAKGPDPNEETPLWYYVLREAERQREGRSLGETGTRVVAETLLNVLEEGGAELLDPAWRPRYELAPAGRFGIVELLRYAGVLVPPWEAAAPATAAERPAAY